jgi:hypothetical protein
MTPNSCRQPAQWKRQQVSGDPVPGLFPADQSFRCADALSEMYHAAVIREKSIRLFVTLSRTNTAIVELFKDFSVLERQRAVLRIRSNIYQTVLTAASSENWLIE